MKHGLMLVLAAALLISAPAHSGARKARGLLSRAALFKAQTRLLDRRFAEPEHMAEPLPAFGEVTMPLRYRGRYRGAYLAMARAVARKYAIPEALFVRLVEYESGWDPRATSQKGAVGLAQLMPETARRLGVNAHDPRANLEGGARYLRRQYERFHSWRLALAAYNAGPDVVAQYKGVPPFRETQDYVRSILGKS